MVAMEQSTVKQVKLELTDREFAQLLQTARNEDIHHKGVYDLRGAVVSVWERPWADTDAWKYLTKVGELHYQHPAATVPATVRRIVLYGQHTVEEMVNALAHLTGRDREQFDVKD